MAKAPLDIRSLARKHSPRALQVLAGIMDNPNSLESARVAAANSLLDRGWGKAAQAHTGEDGEGPIKLHAVIEQVIVDPQN